MRNINNDVADNNFRQYISFTRDFVQQEIFRFSNINDRSPSRIRNGPLNFGARQLINLGGTSDYAIVGGSMTSVTVGS